MNYVTTNIRIPEEDYLRLKVEAAKKRKSFSAVVREKITSQKNSKVQLERLWKRRERVAADLGKKLKDFDVVKALREMRYEGKW